MKAEYKGITFDGTTDEVARALEHMKFSETLSRGWIKPKETHYVPYGVLPSGKLIFVYGLDGCSNMNRDDALAEVKRVEENVRSVGFVKTADALSFLFDENQRLRRALLVIADSGDGVTDSKSAFMKLVMKEKVARSTLDV